MTSKGKKSRKVKFELSEDVRKAVFSYIFAYGSSITIEHERAGTILSELSEKSWIKTIDKLEPSQYS